MYKLLIKPFLFLFDPEKIHHFTFSVLKFFLKAGFMRSFIGSFYCVEDKKLERKLFGLNFKNPVGLAAGFDKDAKLTDELACFGFSHIEIGTVTPKSQPGNDKPRLFRLKKNEAIINRMGFNNGGATAAALKLAKRKNKGLIIGGNIGKNKNTPNENAVNDYELCFEALYEVVDYFVVNVSSPNTPGLRALQDKEPLTLLLNRVMELNRSKPKAKPVLLKIAPDLTNEQLDDIIEIVSTTKINGVIATNTTISRADLNYTKEEIEKFGAGGLSGVPLQKKSTEVISYLAKKSAKAFPIIGIGGIHDGNDAIEKLKAGADLVQLYTGFIYEGPAIVKRINKAILRENL
ncbi:MAG: quinone-dependent dihydroorotate dehydrogenase [Bacteroidia bacterium]|nr:quinone-dependent dihydroorotate dehydrogenase [Bacteroidia bacterium]